jgi:hypothetical protein
MDERYEQFLIATGDMCAAASLAKLVVEVRTASGQQIQGVPSSVRSTEGRDEVDDTGYGRWFQIGGTVMRLDEIVKCSLSAPDHLTVERLGHPGQL